MTAAEALLAAGALHLGFQLVVTGVVYPALAEVPDADWTRAHDAHSRRITMIVAPFYLLLAAACLWVLVSGPYDALTLTSVAGAAIAALTTALVAAPTHGRLERDGRNEVLMRRLRFADGVRLGGAVLCAACAFAA
ncbi:hypothetical protein GCM10007304_10970 [Rhodococcoides trifolii]|uniref:DUF1772 domain-containing protein n=1 Tax=Rhodococcoides trifolii TaxID=908250 RepID=A0A917FSX5_9NOCA|nr:hypothetical protein [Rhodococcus trifolii]GGF98841.1 hypothetical protein GCM10007304_10970 [Rhodococcus trifolii]